MDASRPGPGPPGTRRTVLCRPGAAGIPVLGGELQPRTIAARAPNTPADTGEGQSNTSGGAGEALLALSVAVTVVRASVVVGIMIVPGGCPRGRRNHGRGAGPGEPRAAGGGGRPDHRGRGGDTGAGGGAGAGAGDGRPETVPDAGPGHRGRGGW